MWPYICAQWPAATRLQKIIDHYKFVDSVHPSLTFPVTESLEIIEMSTLILGLRIVIDKPKWFIREGQMTVNLFVSERRLFSLAFSFGIESGRSSAYIGGIQGVRGEESLNSYRDLTKVLYGIRPRDFLFEVFRGICRSLDVRQIYAISDTGRHHRSTYFGKVKAESLHVEYDEIWRERGGQPYGASFFRLSSDSNRRELTEIPSKKRAMYRKRYEFLTDTEEQIATALGTGSRHPHGSPVATGNDGLLPNRSDALGQAAESTPER